MRTPRHQRPAERGIVLISSLLLLLLLTILGLSMFRSFGIQEKIAGNLREKHRALQAAETAQQYAELWLTQGTNVNTIAVCSTLLNANANQGTVCSNKLTTVVSNIATVPWTSNGVPVGTSYTPPGMNVVAAAGYGTFVQAPVFYISLLGPSAGGQGTVYQIDAVGYGGTTDAIAVVESTFAINTGVRCLSC
jgi:type IV pilus assembly protein PilX